jgi:peptidoglycan/LPS O-acetylase OafA/YrhL
MITHPAQTGTTLKDAGSILLYFFNFRLVSQMPDTNLHQWLFSHVWSLSVEEQFYLVWPFLLAGAYRFGVRKRYLLALMIAGIVYPGVARWLLWDGTIALNLYFRTDLRLDGLMYGALVAWLTEGGHTPSRKYARVVGLSGAAATVGLLVIGNHELLASGVAYRGGLSLANLLSAAIIASLVWYPPRLLRLAFEMAWLRWLGTISYGIYLWHWPVMRVMHDWPIENPVRPYVGIPVSVAIAAVSFHAVERYFLRMKKRFVAPAKGASAETAQAPASAVAGEAEV